MVFLKRKWKIVRKNYCSMSPWWLRFDKQIFVFLLFYWSLKDLYSKAYHDYWHMIHSCPVIAFYIIAVIIMTVRYNLVKRVISLKHHVSRYMASAISSASESVKNWCKQAGLTAYCLSSSLCSQVKVIWSTTMQIFYLNNGFYDFC